MVRVSDWEAERRPAAHRTGEWVERPTFGERRVERRPIRNRTDRVLDPCAHGVEQGPDARPHQLTQRSGKTEQPGSLTRVPLSATHAATASRQYAFPS